MEEVAGGGGKGDEGDGVRGEKCVDGVRIEMCVGKRVEVF